MRRIPRTLSLLIFLIYSATLIGCGEGHKAAADDGSNAPVAAVVKVSRGSIADNLEIASEFEPFQEVDVYAKVSGYIKKLYVDYGTHVKQGQILAVLEIPELQQQLQQDQASIRRSDQELTRARDDLNRAQSAYNVAHLTYYAPRRCAEIASGTYFARGNRRIEREGSGSGRRRVRAESGSGRCRRSIARGKGCARQGSGHVRLRAHDGAV